MDKILVTGVAGFIGSNLAQRLLENENNIVYGVDNFSSSTMSNLYPLLKNERFHFEEWDLIKPYDFCSDKIYHLAGCGDLKRYFENKYEYILEQIEITKNIISLARKNGAKLILTTQNKDYSSQNKEMFEYYDMLKLIEDLALNLIYEHKLNAIFACIDYVYGKNMQQNDKRIIPTAIINAFNNKDIIEEYDESFYFTHIQDVVLNLEKLMNHYSSRPIVDVFNSSLYLKSDIIKLIFNYIKSSSKLELKTLDSFNPNYSTKPTTLDNGVIIECKTPVLEGILATIQHFKLMYFS